MPIFNKNISVDMSRSPSQVLKSWLDKYSQILFAENFFLLKMGMKGVVVVENEKNIPDGTHFHTAVNLC